MTFLFIALPILGLFILWCFIAIIVTFIKGLSASPPQVGCERCGAIRTDKGGRLTYTYPPNYKAGRGMACHTIGHAWTKTKSKTNQPKELT